MMKCCSVLLTALLAACGGKSAPDSTAPEGPGDGHADHHHASDDGAGHPGTADEAPPETPAEEPTPTPDPAQVKADLLAAEQSAYEAAKPVFEKHCMKCHSKDSKKSSAKALEHFEMTSYPFGGHHAMEVGAEVRKSLGIGGGKPTMPRDKPGAVKGDELALVAAWADAFDASHAGGAHEGHGDGHDHDHHAP